MKNSVVFGILFILLILLLLLDVIVGAIDIPLADFYYFLKGEVLNEGHRIIIADFRIPKAITAILCGSSLALSGLLMQTLFRNPLAGPYILGISSGAGLGVALVVMGAGFIGFSTLNTFSLSLAALGGAALVMLLLFVVSLKVKDMMTLLIFGILLGSIATAIISLIQFYTSDFQLKTFILWSMGSLSVVNSTELIILAIALVTCTLIAIQQAKGLNALLISDHFASNLGVSTFVVKLIVLLIGGILAGLCTAYCGPIAFVGIIVPHFARLILNTTNHILLIPASILIGANVLLISDLLSTLPANGLQIPINSITSIIGIPFIFWIIFGKKSISKTM